MTARRQGISLFQRLAVLHAGSRIADPGFTCYPPIQHTWNQHNIITGDLSMSEQLIKSYSLRLVTPDCHADAGWYSVYLDLQDDITEALPYLNAELKAFDYNHSASIMLRTCEEKRYAFRPLEIAIAPVADMEEAQTLAAGIIAKVNDIWSRRASIEPDFEGRKTPPGLLSMLKLLPGTNCKECGFPTCMAYAAALRNDSAKLTLCPHISEEDYMNLVP